MASLVLAKRNLRRTSHDVFDVDRALFDYCRVPDVGREQVGEFGSDVSFLSLEAYALGFTVNGCLLNVIGNARVLECWEGFLCWELGVWLL